MDIQELRKLFRKRIPAAYKDLEEASLLPESEAKRFKIQKANECIETGAQILMTCANDLRGKDELILWHRVENLPLQSTALILYGKSDKKHTHNVASLESIAVKRLHEILVTKSAERKNNETEFKQNIAERIRARNSKLGE